jgi:LysM repeat protein
VARLSRLALIAVFSLAALSVPDVSHANSEYVVQNGDTLFGIAQRSGVRLADLLRANDLSVNSVIQPGQQLTIPGGTASPSLAPPAGATYTVLPGDWLSTIADRHGISLAALLAANNLTTTSVIHPGQQLTIPGGTASPTPAPPAGATYTVLPGDWLSRIADRHGISLAALLAANNLTATSLIRPGQQLTIPGGAASPAPPAAPAGGPTYTVREGDALSAIAARHRVTLASLLDLNDLTVNSVIQPGQQLTLPNGAVASSPSTGTPVDHVVSYAMAQLGKPYRFFTAGPNTYDCSGLTLAAYAQIGVTLIHHSTSQAGQGTAVDFLGEPIRPGDLIFLATRGSPTINHVGMAVSATTWIQARQTGDVVRLAPLPPRDIIMAVRRFIPAS